MDDRNWFARHKVLSGLGIALLIFMIAGIAGGSPDDPTLTAVGASTSPTAAEPTEPTESRKPKSEEPEKTKSEEPEPEEPKSKGIGDKVRDGKFEFTITSLDCGETRVGNEYFNQKAQGQFCFLRLKVENIGDEARTFTGDNQYLFDVKDRKFEADTAAGIYLDDSKSFLEDINPGNTVKGVVVFDVPKSFKPSAAKLHDSFFSGGVEVSLS